MRASDRDPSRPRAPLAPDPSVGRLSAREHEVARLVAAGLTDAAIARRLGLAESTVASYGRRIRQRLRLDSRAEVAAWVTARIDPLDPTGPLRRIDGERPA